MKDEHDEVIANWKEAESRARAAKPLTAYPDGFPPSELDPNEDPSLPTLPDIPIQEAVSKKPQSCKSISKGATDKWCINQCKTVLCPAEMCECDDYTEEDKKAIREKVIREKDQVHVARAASKNPESCRSTQSQVTDAWCAFTCATPECPAGMCKCEDIPQPSESARAAPLQADLPGVTVAGGEDEPEVSTLPVTPELPKASNTEGAPTSAGVDIPVYQPPPVVSEPAGINIPLAPVGTPTGIDADSTVKATSADEEERRANWPGEPQPAVSGDALVPAASIDTPVAVASAEAPLPAAPASVVAPARLQA
jgi:hypothetical protein